MYMAANWGLDTQRKCYTNTTICVMGAASQEELGKPELHLQWESNPVQVLKPLLAMGTVSVPREPGASSKMRRGLA